jgi:hypothetical protein
MDCSCRVQVHSLALTSTAAYILIFELLLTLSRSSVGSRSCLCRRKNSGEAINLNLKVLCV